MVSNDNFYIRYLSDGSEVAVMRGIKSDSNAGHKSYLVCNVVVQGGEEGIDFEHPFTVSKIYDSPPVKKKFEEVVELEKKVEQLREEIYSLENKKSSLTPHCEELRKQSWLQKIDDFLEFKYTHLVIEPSFGNPGIVEATKDALSPYGDLRILTLNYKRGVDFTWKLFQYGSGSGRYDSVHPCFSYNEAVEKLQVIVKQMNLFDEAVVSLDKMKSTVEFAFKYGIKVPVDYFITYYKKIEDSKRALIEKRKREISKIELDKKLARDNLLKWSAVKREKEGKGGKNGSNI
ncbi:MAG: hypothetical protein GY861_21970 [bacterium]|nr:hypothetical protein [bacterium]